MRKSKKIFTAAVALAAVLAVAPVLHANESQSPQGSLSGPGGAMQGGMGGMSNMMGQMNQGKSCELPEFR